MRNHTLVSSSKGMYAISLQGSNKLYFALLLKMFCRAPTYTAAMSGVSPHVPRNGVRGPLNKTRPKNATPVTRRTVGVMEAATPQPNFRKMTRLSNIIEKVATPVYVEKSPMNDEYSFGPGNCNQ